VIVQSLRVYSPWANHQSDFSGNTDSSAGNSIYRKSPAL
jgi:hypothetical protein